MAFNGSIINRITYIIAKDKVRKAVVKDDNDDVVFDDWYKPALAACLENKNINYSNYIIQNCNRLLSNIWPRQNVTPIKLEFKNIPITLRIYDDNYDRSGGWVRAITSSGYGVKLDKHIMHDAIMKCGVAPGGLIEAEFQWAYVNGQGPKLIRIGSQIYRDILDYNKRRKQKKIKSKDLIPGGVYTGLNGKVRVFLGFVDANETFNDYGLKKKLAWFICHNDVRSVEGAQEDIDYYINNIDNNQFYKTPYYFINSIRHSNQEYVMQRNQGVRDWPSSMTTRDVDRIYIAGNSSMVTYLGNIAFDDDLIEAVRQRSLNCLREDLSITTDKQTKAVKLLMVKNLAHYYAPRITMRKTGELRPELQELTEDYYTLHSLVV